ncbi:MAG: hypothetical protein AAGA11_03935 [Pseudomonadota bacterium]
MARTGLNEVAEPLPPNAAEAQEGIIYYTIGLGVFVGLLLLWIAWRGKQWWLIVWSAGLIASGCIALVLF